MYTNPQRLIHLILLKFLSQRCPSEVPASSIPIGTALTCLTWRKLQKNQINSIVCCHMCSSIRSESSQLPSIGMKIENGQDRGEARLFSKVTKQLEKKTMVQNLSCYSNRQQILGTSPSPEASSFGIHPYIYQSTQQGMVRTNHLRNPARRLSKLLHRHSSWVRDRRKTGSDRICLD